MRKVIRILDTDMGIDDVMAIVLMKLQSNQMPDCIIVSPGNTSIDNGVSNLLALRKLLGLDFTVVKGKNTPLPFSDDQFHGADGFAGLSSRFIKRLHLTPEELNGYVSMDAFREQLHEFEEIEYTTIGPLSNLSEFIQDESINGRFTHLYVMGGGLHEYNCEHDTEFNFFVCPGAAKTVLASGNPLILFPLDLTNHQQIGREQISALEGSLLFPEAAPLLEHNFKSNLHFNGIPSAVLHDTMPILFQIHPELFHIETLNLDIDEYGHLFESECGNPVSVAMDVQSGLLFESLKRSLLSPAEAASRQLT